VPTLLPTDISATKFSLLFARNCELSTET